VSRKSLDNLLITYTQIEAGGKLGFVMGRQPSNWAANRRATPLTQQKSDQRVPYQLPAAKVRAFIDYVIEILRAEPA
jgi:putative alpha-1,2-mannosidase